MSGIIGYIGKGEAFPVLLHGLNRFEFRGYDSVGTGTISNGEFEFHKHAGKLKDLKEKLGDNTPKGHIGIAHSRWATHGISNELNSHPHVSNSGKLAIVHKGIVENYASLKEKLVEEGYKFHTETDTEVLINWIEHIQKEGDLNLLEAIQVAMNQVVGAYSLIVIDKEENAMYAVRKGAQLVIGVDKDAYVVATDSAPLSTLTDEVIYMEEKDVYRLAHGEEIKVLNLDNITKTPIIEKLEEALETIEKDGYDHFMLKEIYEQPQMIIDSFRGRMNASEGWVRLGGVNEYRNKLNKAKRIIFGACGTSWHAALVGEYLIEELARIPVEVEYASEFRYRNPIIDGDDVFVAISQSGETADTIAAIELAKENQALIYGICNSVGSTISKMSHAGSYTHAGQEIGIASTKAFTTQVVILTLMALQLADYKGNLSKTQLNATLFELEQIPEKVRKILKLDDEIKAIAKEYHQANNFLFLGRGACYPIALEGALKLKEISYIHAEGYPAAEMKHGPIALIDENMPVVVVANNDSAYEKIVSNIQEVKARKGKVIAIVNEGDTVIKGIADHVIEIPATLEIFAPLVSVVPLQLLAYHIAVWRGADVDNPRNLTKSVTVE
ncbi:glutamine--fructose-6-phosphate transaminase (isomerizing) [Weeksellaceae bacterium KMM 9713]|uniref:Glutamine--fructose-6-phosphate aminotransferase [isomerizing] n=1 Tax=Profundicola chukchiensis TaxID=2961959 RepID=A0A9X4MV74_9FLAO|nr:glutamine--fructose-6-phosphate transaminase (isomerizing) [Profundicola chukchiensis]MDG4945428.1 glutamine--fructose-6-phosphate transaminase (isomerizing) [Profundicola chukchiensis]